MGLMHKQCGKEVLAVLGVGQHHRCGDDNFAALMLTTDPVSPTLLDRKSDKKTVPLFNMDMYKQILGQVIYQCIIILIFHFAEKVILALKSDPNNESVGLSITMGGEYIDV